MKITRRVIEYAQRYPTPFLLVDLHHVRENFRKIKKGISNCEVFYAIKANDNPAIIKELLKEEASFEVTSLNELKLLQKFKVSPEKIICLNPIKTPELLQALYKYDVKIMALDSFEEIDKIAKNAPESDIVLRIAVDNEGSDWPLTKKFGVDAVEAIPLIKYAKRKGLNPIGLTFHVGSQCLNKNNWTSALYICESIWEAARKEGINFNFLSLGGGIPIFHKKPIPAIKDIGRGIKKALKNNFKTSASKLRVTIEPGRAVVGDAAIMITSVIGKAKRGSEKWVYIDVGVFNGLMETVLDFSYEIKAPNKRKKQLVTIAGPSCDSVDIPLKNIMLPEVRVNDRLFIINAGAYTTVYASQFNGFQIPKVRFLKD